MTKLYIGPMSKNVINAASSFDVGLIASRRQIDFNSGYVGINTKQFKETSSNVICRDHGGPNQGTLFDYGYDSLYDDCLYMNIIHIDPWKIAKSINHGIELTIKYINFCYNINPNIEFEIGTEESIYKYDAKEFKLLLELVFANTEANIKYAVIQSGTKLSEDNNIGKYDSEQLKEMIKLCKQYSILSKEHNGDFLSDDLIKEKFNLGLDAINIAPEFGHIETQCYLDYFSIEDKEVFYNLCLKHKAKWEKWFNKIPEDKNKIIKVAGHYVFNDLDFKKLLLKYELNNLVQEKLKDKIGQLLNIIM